MKESTELRKERPLDGRSLRDVLAELDMQLEFEPKDDVAEGLPSAAEAHDKPQVERLLAFIEGLQHENRLLEQRIQTLEAHREWRPWRAREEKRARRDAQVQRDSPSWTRR
jgi:phage terminase small subunit